MGARATGRSAWLIAPGLLVALFRLLLGWTPPIVAIGMILASGDLHDDPLALPVDARSIASLAGVWLSAFLLSGGLRVAWMAGALPTLGGELSSGDGRFRFASGFAYGFMPMLGTALLAYLLQLASQLFAATVLLGTIVLIVRGSAANPVLVSFLMAGALTAAVLGLVIASLGGDAALARTALSGDGPSRALAQGLRRIVRRPGAFLLTAIALGVAASALVGSARAVETLVIGFTRDAPLLVALGPRLLAAVAGGALVAVVELWRLGAVAALACGEE